MLGNGAVWPGLLLPGTQLPWVSPLGSPTTGMAAATLGGMFVSCLWAEWGAPAVGSFLRVRLCHGQGNRGLHRILGMELAWPSETLPGQRAGWSGQKAEEAGGTARDRGGALTCTCQHLTGMYTSTGGAGPGSRASWELQGRLGWGREGGAWHSGCRQHMWDVLRGSPSPSTCGSLNPAPEVWLDHDHFLATLPSPGATT